LLILIDIKIESTVEIPNAVIRI